MWLVPRLYSSCAAKAKMASAPFSSSTLAASDSRDPSRVRAQGDPKYRPLEPKSSRSPKSKGSSLKHKTRSPSDAVKQSEQSLSRLLEDFEKGRLNAFGNSDMLQKMNEIREMQEKLTLKHFEIDQMRIAQESKPGTNEEKDASLLELTQALEKLGNAIQSLHSTDSSRQPKRVAINTGGDQQLLPSAELVATL